MRELERCWHSNRSEFVVVYGRRRIGKTFIIRSYAKDNFSFSYVGVRGLSSGQQLQNFSYALQQHSQSALTPSVKNWLEAFRRLQELLSAQTGRKIVFIDELPWMDSPASGFINALENFWNGWAAFRDDICLIVCGSATSWMTDKLIYNKDGLHNRVTSQIYLRPFTLAETEEYLEASGCHWDRMQITQCYMAMGGVPYYLSLIHPEQSLAQNIDRLYFHKNSELREEFGELYHSLFKNASHYIDAVRILSAHREGMTRQEISQKLKLTGSSLTKLLSDLERCDFILGYKHFGNKKNNVIYRLTDFYTLFYFRFVADDRSQDENWWETNKNKPAVLVWQGLTFELICMLHLSQIKRALGINGISTATSSWRGSVEDKKYQIDIVIDRDDRIINLCEIKFSVAPFVIDKAYGEYLRERMGWFKAETKTRKSPVVTMITTYGVVQNKHSGVVQNEVMLDDLFCQ